MCVYTSTHIRLHVVCCVFAMVFVEISVCQSCSFGFILNFILYRKCSLHDFRRKYTRPHDCCWILIEIVAVPLLFMDLHWIAILYFAYMDWLIAWLLHWLTELTDWLIDWLTDWLTDRLTEWLIDWLTACMTDLLTDSLADWINHSQADWLTDWLIDRLLDWPNDRLTGWFTDWLFG